VALVLEARGHGVQVTNERIASNRGAKRGQRYAWAGGTCSGCDSMLCLALGINVDLTWEVYPGAGLIAGVIWQYASPCIIQSGLQCVVTEQDEVLMHHHGIDMTSK
jgi:hypothetical protein